MRRLPLAVFLVAMATLVLELSLTRVFDVVLTPMLGYLVIACAILSFALAGAYRTVRPPAAGRDPRAPLAWTAAAFGVATLAVLPAFNLLPFDHDRLAAEPATQTALFACMYLVAALPFFLAGLFLVDVFAEHAERIRTLYCWDLVGASLGCFAVLPLVGHVGPGGLLFVASALAFVAVALLAPRKAAAALVVVATGVAAVPFARAPDYFEFREHKAKRWVLEAKSLGRRELVWWDPISKIEVIDLTSREPGGGPVYTQKHIAYDGGNQSSLIFPFDGDLAALRARIEGRTLPLMSHFWHRGVLASHWVKRDSGQRVLIIGCAGGQELKAALVFGAAEVDVVEMVGAALDVARGPYAGFNGGIFGRHGVRLHVDEGRAFLRARDERWDIIQIFSTETSSSIGDGTGAMAPVYLQTAEAYEEYFKHLTDDGILHVNFQTWLRQLTTAALAWRRMGRTDLKRHVVVIERRIEMDTLPTVLIKMSPWTIEELNELAGLYVLARHDERTPSVVYDPLSGRGAVPPEVFSGRVSAALERRAPFRLAPATDDRPYFKFLRESLDRLEPDPQRLVTSSTAAILNAQLEGPIPKDLLHLVLTGLAALIAVALGLVAPLLGSSLGRQEWPRRRSTLVYFACLGAGFILLELVVVQLVMRFVGLPSYGFSTALASLLLSAGLGSMASEQIGITPERRWSWPFWGIGAAGVLLAVGHPLLFDAFAGASLGGRMLVAGLAVFPLGFFLGMPLPLGIVAVAGHPRVAVAWGWSVNGLLTVVGALASVALSVAFGFRATLLIGLAVYWLAARSFSEIRRA